MRKFLMTTAAMAMVMGMAAGAARAADNVEVLHWWTSGGEAAALDVLKKDLESKNISWTDMPVAGGGGTEAMTVLRARVTSKERTVGDSLAEHQNIVKLLRAKERTKALNLLGVHIRAASRDYQIILHEQARGRDRRSG